MTGRGETCDRTLKISKQETQTEDSEPNIGHQRVQTKYDQNPTMPTIERFELYFSLFLNLRTASICLRLTQHPELVYFDLM